MSRIFAGVSHDTEVVIQLELAKLRRTRLGKEWLGHLSETPYWPAGPAYERAGPHQRRAVLTIPIGELPRIGRPQVAGRTTTFPVPEGIGVCTYSHPRGRVQISPIMAINVNGNRPVSAVATERNRTLDVGGECLALFDPNIGTLTRRRAQDCHNYLLPYVRREPIIGRAFNRDVGWLHAVMAADSWLRPSMIGYCKNDGDKRAEFVRIITEQYHIDFSLNEYFDDGSAPDKFAESAKLHLFSRPLREAVYDCYCARGEGRAALYKKLPDALLACGSRECLLGLLAGSLEGDASLGWNHSKRKPQAVCKCNTSSWCQVKSLQHLGRLLGIRTSVTTTPAKGRSRTSYVLCWSLPDVLQIVPELQFVSEEARQWQAEFLGSPPVRDHIDIVPIKSSLAKRLRILLLRKGETNLYYSCRKAIKTFSLTCLAARRILALTHEAAAADPDWQAFSALADNDAIHWDRVQHVFEAGSELVVGLAVCDAGLFMVQNGLLVASCDAE